MKEPVDQHSGPVDAGSDGRKASRTGGVAVGDRRDSHPGARAVGPAGGGLVLGSPPLLTRSPNSSRSWRRWPSVTTWRGAGGNFSGCVGVWEVTELTLDRVTKELLSIAHRAAGEHLAG